MKQDDRFWQPVRRQAIIVTEESDLRRISETRKYSRNRREKYQQRADYTLKKSIRITHFSMFPNKCHDYDDMEEIITDTKQTAGKQSAILIVWEMLVNDDFRRQRSAYLHKFTRIRKIRRIFANRLTMQLSKTSIWTTSRRYSTGISQQSKIDEHFANLTYPHAT